MNTRKLFFALLCMIPTVASASVQYRVQQVRMPVMDGGDETFASMHRFYIGGMYDFAMWDGFTDDQDVHVGGKNTSSFEIVAGARVTDIFRIEANYIRTRAKWNAFSLDGNAGFVNAIIDARIPAMYRILRSQHLVPYVGAGGGVIWNQSSHDIKKKTVPGVAALAGLGIELGEHFTIDLGYRYLYMFSPDFRAVSDLAPVAHQFRAGARINF